MYGVGLFFVLNSKYPEHLFPLPRTATSVLWLSLHVASTKKVPAGTEAHSMMGSLYPVESVQGPDRAALGFGAGPRPPRICCFNQRVFSRA